MILAQARQAMHDESSNKETFVQARKHVRLQDLISEVPCYPAAQCVITIVLIRRVEKLSDGILRSVVLVEYPNIDERSFGKSLWLMGLCRSRFLPLAHLAEY